MSVIGLPAYPLVLASALGISALMLVGPGPSWVARWRFLYRVPRAAVVLWQAGTLAALISVVGAAIPVAVWAAGPSVRAPTSWGRIGGEAPAWAIVLAGLLAVLIVSVAVRLVWSLVSVARTTSARRSRHRSAVDLLDEVQAHPTSRSLRVLAERLPMAYCLPGLGRSRVVLSSGTLTLLDTDEVAAVIAHETAHVRARHDVVLDTFTALHRAFPVAVRSELPERECRLLVEMLADDAARTRVGRRPLARALVALADSPVPADALGAGQTGVRLRVERLALPGAGYSRPLAVAVYALAAALVAGPLVLLSL
ncbi:M56 family metallopeptidase [Microlunatus ginsengisoli]|uniref:M56 family metallopeptidase n=1 Tax=Microlunatus ginsengisoli TaxID=363863 RepID=A0ABP6ZI11_9ACTN